jgi:pyruvate kinase
LGNEKRIHISYPYLCQDLSHHDRIFINDGIVELVVIDKEDKDLICEVLNGGTVSSRKGCNFFFLTFQVIYLLEIWQLMSLQKKMKKI